MQQRKFTGRFKDVSKLNPQLVVAEGNYTADGLKDGSFISRYLNGNLQTKGNFKNNKLDGKWEMYYDDGKPKLTFEANGIDIKIIDNWDTKGSKIVDNGKGNYLVDLGELYWKGKLVNGKPDGTWKAMLTDDATNATIISESYKAGVFKKGNGPMGDYTDAPKLVLVAAEKIPFVEAEKLRVSTTACNGSKIKHIVNAQYSDGFNTFTTYIQNAVGPFLNTVNLQPYDNELLLEGEVDVSGRIVNLRTHNAFDDKIARGLIRQFNTLPDLHPAMADGKPIKQKFTVLFTFNRGSYRFTYTFLAIPVN